MIVNDTWPALRRLMLMGFVALGMAACGGGDKSAERAPVDLGTPEIIGTSVWDVDGDASSVGFRGVMNDKTFEGSFDDFVIGIALNPEDPASEGVVEARFDLASASTGEKDKDEALPTETWFHVSMHPVATFRSDDIRETAPGTYEAVGTLSIKGVSRPVTLPFSLTVNDDGRAVADGSVTISRSSFSIGTGEFANGKWVEPEIEVLIHVEAVPAG